jgi:hypothetical protein
MNGETMSTFDQPTGQHVNSPAAPPPAPYAPVQYAQTPHGQSQYGQPQHAQATAGAQMQPMHAPARHAAPMGPVGKIRNTWAVMGLSIITFGIYTLVYYYSVHEEMKRHSGQGVGGVLGLVLSFFLAFVSPFLLSNEVGDLYARQGQRAPVSAATGLWVIPGSLIVIGPFIWLFKTNGALNDYWRSVGAH